MLGNKVRILKQNPNVKNIFAAEQTKRFLRMLTNLPIPKRNKQAYQTES
jgi:hypothetical protein